MLIFEAKCSFSFTALPLPVIVRTICLFDNFERFLRDTLEGWAIVCCIHIIQVNFFVQKLDLMFTCCLETSIFLLVQCEGTNLGMHGVHLQVLWLGWKILQCLCVFVYRYISVDFTHLLPGSCGWFNVLRPSWLLDNSWFRCWKTSFQTWFQRICLTYYFL